MAVRPRIPTVREIIDRRGQSATSFTYPGDIENFPHKTVMLFNKYSIPRNPGAIGGEASFTPTCAITMPVPIKIYEPYNIGYQSDNLGVAGAGIVNLLQTLNAGSVYEGGVRAALGVGGGAAVIAGQALLAGALARLGSIPGIQTIINQAPGALSVATGLSVNPYTTARFKGVPLRQFELKWKVSPETKKDTTAIEGIIDAIRLRIHPEPTSVNLPIVGELTTNVILEFPELVTFKILGSNDRNLDDFTFPTAPCFVQGFTVDRTGGDFPTFYAESGAPVVYYIQMNVVEILPLLRSGDKLEMNNPLFNE